MKRIISTIILLAIILNGCAQIEPLHSDLEDSIKFTASFEDNVTRTYVEEGNLMRWTKGDQISIFVGNVLNQQYQFDGNTGDQDGTFTKVSSPFGGGDKLNCHYAVYPYADDIKINKDGVITVTLPSEQSYFVNSFAPNTNTMVAVTKDTDDTLLKFKNACGYLKFKLYGEDIAVKTITLTGNENTPLAGKATITASHTSIPTLCMDGAGSDTITLECGDGVKIGTTAETATAFWFVIPPTTFENGFTVTVTDTKGKQFSKSTSKEVVIERNAIRPMTAFEVKIEKTIPDNQIWYSSKNGMVMEPYNKNGFGAGIISNTYQDGKGVIVFDGNITSIGDEAFKNCRELTEISIPEQVSAIGQEAFYYCTNLVGVSLSGKVTSIGSDAFYYCTELSTLNISDLSSWCNINFYFQNDYDEMTCVHPFYYSNKYDNRILLNGVEITELTIPDGVKQIGAYAFYRCPNIRKVNIPDSVTSIGTKAFVDNGLESFIFSSHVTNIGYDILDGNPIEEITCNVANSCSFGSLGYLPKLTSLKGERVSNNSLIIGNSLVIFDCKNTQKSYTVPENIKYLARYSFANKTLDDVILHSDIYIAERAFNYAKIGQLNIPNGVNDGYEAFNGCKADRVFIDIWHIDGAPEDDFGPYENADFTEIIFGPNVTYIGECAFGSRYTSNRMIERIYFQSPVPPEGSSYINEGGIGSIYVPRDYLETYKKDDVWGDMDYKMLPY